MCDHRQQVRRLGARGMTAKGKAPAFQFYAADWLSKPRLRACSIETRGVWIDFLAQMHLNDRSGVVEGDLEGLARSVGIPVENLRRCIEELDRRDVATVTWRNGHADVTVVSRRMHREHRSRSGAKRRKRSQRSKQGELDLEEEGCHADVTPLSSSSSSSSTSKGVEEGGGDLRKTASRSAA